jgi:hypothetical protein
MSQLIRTPAIAAAVCNRNSLEHGSHRLAVTDLCPPDTQQNKEGCGSRDTDNPCLGKWEYGKRDHRHDSCNEVRDPHPCGVHNRGDLPGRRFLLAGDRGLYPEDGNRIYLQPAACPVIRGPASLFFLP